MELVKQKSSLDVSKENKQGSPDDASRSSSIFHNELIFENV